MNWQPNLAAMCTGPKSVRGKDSEHPGHNKGKRMGHLHEIFKDSVKFKWHFVAFRFCVFHSSGSLFLESI